MEVLRNGKYVEVVGELIRAAERSVRVAMFQVQMQGKKARAGPRVLTEGLAWAGLNGIDCRVILNVVGARGRVGVVNRDAAVWLQERKVKVAQLWPRRLCHAKLVIIDDEVAVIGSHNWSVGAMGGNFEVSVVLEDWGAVVEMAAWFDLLWSVCKPVHW